MMDSDYCENFCDYKLERLVLKDEIKEDLQAVQAFQDKQ